MAIVKSSSSIYQKILNGEPSLQVNYLFQEIPLARQYNICAFLGILYHFLNRLGCPRLVGSDMQPTLGAEWLNLILS
jgi:hypothetical protein